MIPVEHQIWARGFNRKRREGAKGRNIWVDILVFNWISLLQG